MDDAYIISLYFARDQQAIAETDRKYGAICRRLSLSITGDSRDAEECVNDTYLAAWEAIPPAHPHPLVAFLLKITRNLSLKRYHYNTADRRNSHFDVALSELEGALADEDRLEAAEDSRQITRALEAFLDGLSRENRVIFLRRYWFSDSIGEIADRVGLSQKVISARLARMRENLRKRLQKEGIL